MSSDNVDAVRRVYEVFAASGQPPWELFASDAVMDARDASPDILVLRDRRRAADAFASYVRTFERYTVQLEEVIRADAVHVVTVVRDGGRIRGSDAEVWNRFFHVFTFRDGKIVRWSTHTDRDRALSLASD
jgi:ketosteroid isomerase-like protein